MGTVPGVLLSSSVCLRTSRRENVVQQRGLARSEKAGEHRKWKFVVNFHGWCKLGCHIGKMSCCRRANQSGPRPRRISMRGEKERMQRLLTTLNMSTPPMLPKGCARPISLNWFASSGTRRILKRPRRRNRLRATKWVHHCSKHSNRLEPQTKMAWPNSESCTRNLRRHPLCLT